MDGKKITVSAPGKIILHGEHSVSYGKRALAVGLGLRSTAVIEELPMTVNPQMYIDFPNVGINDVLPLKPIAKMFSSEENSWNEPTVIDHVKHLKKVDELLYEIRPGFDKLPSFQKNSLRGVLYAFGGIYGSSDLDIKDFSLKMMSDLTVGAGTGSSASFATCLCGVIMKLVKLKKTGEVEQFNEDEKKIVSAWAYNLEKITHGNPSGIDNTTSTFGSLVAFKKGEEPLLLPSPELRILLIDSRVPRETSKLTAAVSALRFRNTAAVDHILDAMDQISVTAAELLKQMSELRSKDKITTIYDLLQELWNMNHCLLGSLGVSHPVLEKIRTLAMNHGLACKLTGAGGGGNAIILVPPTTEEDRITALKAELLDSGFGVTDTMVGGTGIELHY